LRWSDMENWDRGQGRGGSHSWANIKGWAKKKRPRLCKSWGKRKKRGVSRNILKEIKANQRVGQKKPGGKLLVSAGRLKAKETRFRKEV